MHESHPEYLVVVERAEMRPRCVCVAAYKSNFAEMREGRAPSRAMEQNKQSTIS